MGTPAPPEEMSAAVDEPGSAGEFLERRASLLLIRLLATESRVRPPDGTTEQGAHRGRDPSWSASSLSLSLSLTLTLDTRAHTNTHTHTLPPASEGLGGNVYGCCSRRGRKGSGGPGGHQLVTGGGPCRTCDGERVSGPARLCVEASGGPAPGRTGRQPAGPGGAGGRGLSR